MEWLPDGVHAYSPGHSRKKNLRRSMSAMAKEDGMSAKRLR
jgi:hypothetical protein